MSKDDRGRDGGHPDDGSSGAKRKDRLDYPRLEDSDLSLRLSKEEEATRLEMAQRRLLHLRLINGGQLNDG